MTDDHSASMLILDLSDLSESSSFLYEDYETDEVVWAKIQGYPWWPAYVHFFECRLSKCNKHLKSILTSS